MNTHPEINSEERITVSCPLPQTAKSQPEFTFYDYRPGDRPRLDVYVPEKLMVLFCEQGSLTLTVNHDQTYALAQGDLLISLPRTSLEDFTPSEDMHLRVLCLSSDVINDSLLADNTLWPSIEFVKAHTLIHLTEEEMKMGQHYRQLYKIYSEGKDTKFKNYIIHTLHKVIIYQIADLISERMQDKSENTPYSQTDTTFKRFLHLLAVSKGKVRNVAYFARELCITTKYLSHIVKEKTGHSAKQIIDETVSTEIRHQLCYTSKTVKEIANDLNFPSLSFFGTYTRKHLNASPANIRKEYRTRK